MLGYCRTTVLTFALLFSGCRVSLHLVPLPFALVLPCPLVIDAPVPLLLQKKKTTTIAVEVKKSQHKYVIGPKGNSLQEILEKTGVSVEIPPTDSSSETVILRGEPEKLGQALTEVYAKVLMRWGRPSFKVPVSTDRCRGGGLCWAVRDAAYKSILRVQHGNWN